ncbi:MAG: efflux RND transporter periplasmic adaptor subunit [Clostridia bacterium]|nr:efflux RND transporter periplasmic adaptor subunit [Clostridia bacterium]
MKKRKVLVITSLVVVAALLVGVGLSKSGTKSEVVKTATVTKGDLKSYLSTNAIIQSKNTKNYVGAAQLPVKSVKVKVGDNVKKGQVMLEYDIYDLNASVTQAKLQYNNAVLQKSELLSQKEQLDDNIEKLDNQIKELEGSKNPSDALQLQTLKQKRDALQPISDEKLKLMDNSVSLAKVALDSANSKLEKYKGGIVADFDGVVTALNAIEGATLNPAQPAVTLQQLDNLKAVMSLGKYDSLKVKVGQEAILKNGSKLYKGEVSFISPAAAKAVSMGGQDTSLQAEIDILDEDADLKVDFDANVDILLGSIKDAVKVPVESIKYEKDVGSYVFKVVDGKAKRVVVKPGLQSDMEAQITEGLSVGDTIVLNPSMSIKDGTEVRTNEGEK